MCDGPIQITVEVSVEEGVGKRVHGEMLCFGASCGVRTKFEISCSAPRDCSFGLFVKLMFQIQCLVLI